MHVRHHQVSTSRHCRVLAPSMASAAAVAGQHPRCDACRRHAHHFPCRGLVAGRNRDEIATARSAPRAYYDSAGAGTVLYAATIRASSGPLIFSTTSRFLLKGTLLALSLFRRPGPRETRPAFLRGGEAIMLRPSAFALGVILATSPTTLLAQGPPPDLPPQAAADFDGELEVQYEDSNGGARLRHFLHASNRQRLKLEFAAEAPELLTGTIVRAHGVRQNNTLMPFPTPRRAPGGDWGPSAAALRRARRVPGSAGRTRFASWRTNSATISATITHALRHAIRPDACSKSTAMTATSWEPPPPTSTHSRRNDSGG